MMRPKAVALATMLLCTPLAVAAQGMVPERFGYCFAIDVPSSAVTTSPAFRPALAAGEPEVTVAILAPPLAASSS